MSAPERPTPYALVFGGGPWEEKVFGPIAEEAAARGEDPARFERFGFLTHAADALRAMVPPDAPLEAREEYAALLFHGFAFHRAGRPVLDLDPAVARFLVEGAPSLEGWELALPAPSVYLRLPPNLFWASVDPEAPPEPVDGLFAAVDPAGGGAGTLRALMVLGMRRDRPGFSAVPLEAEAPPGAPAAWSATPGREDGADFATDLPGGELAGLYSVRTAAEALKLLARGLWYADAHPDDVEDASSEEPDDGTGDAVRRVRIGGGG